MPPRRTHTPWLIATLAAAFLLTPALAEEPKPVIPRNATEITDAQVLESIRRGSNFLLSTRKDDNWETGDHFGPGENFHDGGETSLVLYALLHVGQSVHDEPELGPKLRFNSPELAPVVRWVAKLKPRGTYTAGLQASALALVPEGSDLGKEAHAGLLRARDYLVGSMGADGGYGYFGLGNYGGHVDFSSAWKAHVDARIRNDQKAIGDSLMHLEWMAKAASASFLGVRGHLEMLNTEIRARLADATAKKDTGAKQRAEGELRLLAMVQGQLLKQFQTADLPRRLADAEKRHQAAQEAAKTGVGYKTIWENGAAKKAPQTKQEIDTELADAKRNLERAQFEVRNNFRGSGDLSNGQYGTLGAWALDDAEIELPRAYWQVSDRFWRLSQRPDGCWGYHPSGERPSNTMGVAGIASLFLTAEQIDTQIRLEPRKDKEIENGLAWLNASFQADTNGYYMYGVERVGLASGLKFFGTRNWFKEGALTIMKGQMERGAFGGGFYAANDNRNTAYGLLFLARGRNPVAFNKLEYDGPWNARPRDNANITNWMSKRFESPINWQIVNLKVQTDELLDAPIMLITGSKPLNFSDEEIAKLRAFVHAGGMIFSTADGGKDEFTESVRKVASKIVEEAGKPRYEMRELPKEHVLFSQKNELAGGSIAKPPKILAMSNSVREIWVHSTVDMGASWQGRKVANQDHYYFPANLYRYASGRTSLRSKLQPLAVPDTKEPAVRSTTLARVDHNGNWDPEPGAWPRLAKILRKDAKTELKIQTVRIGKLDPKATPIAHITGTGGVPATTDDVAALKAFLDGGGTIIADAAGGNPEFKVSLDNLVQKVTGKPIPFAPIERTSRLYNGSIPDSLDTTTCEYRWFYRQKFGTRKTPRLQGVEQGGRFIVIFSEEDITSGLLGTQTWGIMGYAPDSAQALARNIVLYCMDPKAGKDGAPAAGTQTQEAPK